MSHEHKLRDTDPYFRIDPDTRLITDLSDNGTTIVQGDHNSERFTFELPRFIDGHDMSMCNVVEIHYINIGSNERHSDVYEVLEEDRETIRIANSSDEALLCSWLLSNNATALSGTLNFALRFKCTSTGEDGEAVVDYSWGTGIYTKIVINPGIDNSDIVVEQYADVLEEWRQQLFGSSNEKVDTYSKTEIDEMMSNPTITETILLTNENTIVNRDETLIENDGVSTSTILFSSMYGQHGGAVEIPITGHVKFTCSIEEWHYADIYIDGDPVVYFGNGIGHNGEYTYSFDGEVKNRILIELGGNELIFTELKKITVIADELGKINTELESGTSVSQSANAFVKMVSGEAIRVDDVSPIKHKAKVKVSGKNLLNIDGMVNSSFVKNNDGSYTLTKIGSGRFTNLVDISIPANTIVTVSARKVEGTADGFALQTLNEDGTYTSIVSLSQTKTYASAKVTSNTESIRLYLGAGDTDGTYVTISDLQIELGNTATEYESYVNPTTTTVTACGKNFWQSKLNYPRTVSGVTIDYDPETQIYTFNGASTAAGDLYTMPNNTHIMTINPGETWTLKVEVMGGDVDGNPTSSGKISPLVNTSTYTNTIHANAESLYMTKKYTEVADITKMYFYVYAAGIVFNNLKLRIQFELSDKPTEFEKFVEFTNYTPDSNGNIEIDSISPTMTVLTDTDSAIIYLTYNRDLNKVMGDVESALDIMLNIQNVLIGGAN